MAGNTPYTPMASYHKNICEYGGGFGVLLSLICLIQHLILAIPNKVTNPMIPVYFLAMSGFLLLALQKVEESFGGNNNLLISYNKG